MDQFSNIKTFIDNYNIDEEISRYKKLGYFF